MNITMTISVYDMHHAAGSLCKPMVEMLHEGMFEPDNRFSLDEWTSEEQVWLVDLIAPFATADTRQRETMIADLISKPLAGIEFHFD